MGYDDAVALGDHGEGGILPGLFGFTRRPDQKPHQDHPHSEAYNPLAHDFTSPDITMSHRQKLALYTSLCFTIVLWVEVVVRG